MSCKCWERNSPAAATSTCRPFIFRLSSPLCDEALDLYADVVLNPAFPESDFERQRQLQLAAIANEKVTPLQMALRALPPLFMVRNTPMAFH